MRKEYKKIMIIFLFFLTLKCACYGISDEFKFVIDTIGVPRYNVLGDEINERAYNTYHVFVYSNPTAMYHRTSAQRFKEVANGKWTKDGKNGEYDILGVDYSGGFVYNVYFPVDNLPECLPDQWHYIGISGALSSWNDASKYKYQEQIEYMKQSRLLFDRIDYASHTIDPYHLVEYPITPLQIGLDKIRLNTAATWKTYGIVSINRINHLGQVRYATLAIKPIAASADVSSYIEVPQKIVLDENSDEAVFTIKYGARAVHLNEYAKVEHIKEISSNLSIDGMNISKVKDARRGETQKSYQYKISREKLGEGTYTLTLKNHSYLYTEFYVDGLMQNEIEKNVTIQINPKKVVPIEKVNVKVLEKEGTDFYARDLFETVYSQSTSSIGILEKEKHMAIYLKSGEKQINQEDLKLWINEVEIPYQVIEKRDFAVILDIKIPEQVSTSILSWNQYRNMKKDYFQIDFHQIGKRIKEPNQLKIKFSVKEQTKEEIIFFDTIDSYPYNMNYTFENGVTNQGSERIKIADWEK